MLSILQMSVAAPAATKPAPSITSTVTPAGHQTWIFQVSIRSGPLEGETFIGQFSCDPTLLMGNGTEHLSPESLKFYFDGAQFQATDDVHYPLRPMVKFIDGVLVGLDYQVWIQRCFGINQDSFWYEGGQGSVNYSPALAEIS